MMKPGKEDKHLNDKKTDRADALHEKRSSDAAGSPPEGQTSTSEKVQGGPKDSAKGEARGAHVTLAREEYDSLKARLSELEAMKDNMLRVAAEFENSKKRLMRERDEFVKFSQENLIRNMLGVLDNFGRAMFHANEFQDPAVKGLVTGVEMVFKQLADILKNQGLVRLETVGKKFDPHRHEAIGYVQEDGPEDVIVDEIEPGYLLHDRLLRAAKVRVRMTPAKGPSAEGAPPSKEEEIT
ncbi:MAG: nucleotide exchange factor GrpE [Candidatus Omnitrophica bacterium]|nr:nucleotide exchange factor GrpE [Candidatus Omnitrophota bacterium]MDD5671860.1 nucleotide exchange factor GrpE [Candidatus Omnitrophota bacterium]